MNWDKNSLRVLLELSSRVEEVSWEAVRVRESLTTGENTPEEWSLQEIVSSLERVSGTIEGLVNKFPEEAVLQVKSEIL